MKPGVLLLLTGPIGSGKDAVMGELIKRFGWQKIVTYTTRPMRAGEIPDWDYHFVTEAEFEQMGDQLIAKNTNEWTKSQYGTSKKDLEKVLNGDKLIWRIDPLAAIRAKDEIRTGFSKDREIGQAIVDRVVIVYLRTKNWEDMAGRIRQRDGELAEKGLKRLKEEQLDWEKNQQWFRKITVYNEDNRLDATVQKIEKRVAGN